MKNPQAFPLIYDDSHNSKFKTEEGMTLRDYFAAKAMQAFIQHNLHRSWEMAGNDDAGKRLSIKSFSMADAMLKEREKNNPMEG